MVKLRIEDDGTTPKEVYNWRVYYFATQACWASVMIGYDSAFIGSSMALQSFKDEFGLTGQKQSELDFLSANIVSTYQAGCFFGALLAYFFGYYLGRKWGLFLSALVFLVGAVLQIVSSHKTGLGIMYAGRAIAGLAVGAASNLTPCYLSETAPPAIRGRVIGLYELGWQIGAVVGFWIGYGVNQHIPYGNKQWMIPFAVQLIPGGMLAIGIATIRESPRWLASKGRIEKALSNLSYIRKLPEDHPYIQEEMGEIVMNIEHDEERAGKGVLGPMRALFQSKDYMKRLGICVLLFAMQNGTGINSINYYSPTVFKAIGVQGTSASLLTTGVFGVIKFAVAFIWLLWLVDNVGRKALFIIGSIGGALCMYYLGAYIAIAKPTLHPTTSLTAGGKSAVASVYIWTVFYGPTWNGGPWVVSSEVMPTFLRSATQAFIAASNWLFAFIIARFTPNMFTKMGYGVFIMFATMMIVSVPVVYVLLPETKTVPLEHMDELFAENPRHAHKIVMDRLKAAHAHGAGEKPESNQIEKVESTNGGQIV